MKPISNKNDLTFWQWLFIANLTTDNLELREAWKRGDNPLDYRLTDDN